MTSASDPKEPKPSKRGRPEERVVMTPEEAEKVLDKMLGKPPVGDEPADEDEEKRPDEPSVGPGYLPSRSGCIRSTVPE